MLAFARYSTLLSLCILLCNCKPTVSDAKLVGIWECDPDVRGDKRKIVLSPDHTFTAYSPEPNSFIDSSGTWRIDGDQLVTDAKTQVGEPVMARGSRHKICNLSERTFAAKEPDSEEILFTCKRIQ